VPSDRNGRAWASVLVGLVAIAVLPAAIGLSELLEAVRLLDTAAAIPVAAALAIAALWLSHAARRQIERTIGRIGGAGAARAGKVLGVLGLCLAAAGAIALGTYYALSHFAE
jgi:hypothetical protein